MVKLESQHYLRDLYLDLHILQAEVGRQNLQNFVLKLDTDVFPPIRYIDLFAVAA